MSAIGQRTEFDVGEIFRRWGPAYSRTHPMTAQQRKVMRILAMCRTSALGGHLERCDRCGRERPVYNSCGERHCPTCQGALARKWLERRLEDVLNTAYFHTIFTLPDTFDCLVAGNEATLYDLLLRAAADALKALAQKHLDGQPGIVAILHTWGQTLWLHPHVHCIVTGGALSADRRRWRSTGPTGLFDVYELSAAFRDRFCALLRRARLVFTAETGHLAERTAFEGFVDGQQARDWVVYCKPPVAGPQQVLEYISRYTHRVAISNRRIVDVTDEGRVTFAYKDYADRDAAGNPRGKTLTLTAVAFIGRFLRHVLPRGFRKIRTYGILAGRDSQAKLAASRALLGPVEQPETVSEADDAPSSAAECCPHCGGNSMRRVATLHPQRAPPVVLPWTKPGEAA
jgi:hypothetical protein